MKAVQGKGSPESLTIVDVEVPRPDSNQALVRVVAFAVNEVDLLQRSTPNYPLPSNASPILGVELSGVIVAFGSPPPNDWKIGDCVFGFVPRGGAYAEYAIVDLDNLILKPSSITYAEAASLPGAWLSALLLLSEKAHFEKRQKLVVLDAATPTGFATVQLAQLMGCRRVYAGVRTETSAPKGLALLESLPDEVVPVLLPQVPRAVKHIDPEGVNAVIDLTADPSNCRGIALADSGITVLSHVTPVPQVNVGINLVPFIYKGAGIAGSPHPRSVSQSTLQRLQEYFVEHVLPRIANKNLPLHIAPVKFSFKDVAAAHKWAETYPEGGRAIVEI